MKKTVLFIATIVSSFAIINLTACQKNISTETALNFDNIHTDSRFQKFVSLVQEDVSRVKDVKTISAICRKTTLTEQDIDKLSIAFGYPNKADYIKNQKSFINNLNELNKSYRFNEKSKRQLQVAVNSVFSELHFVGHFKKSGSASEATNLEVADPCETARLSCLASTASQAVIMHIGCSIPDMTLILGLLCHSAVVVYQVSTSINCNATAASCTGASGNQ